MLKLAQAMTDSEPDRRLSTALDRARALEESGLLGARERGLGARWTRLIGWYWPMK